MSGVRLVVTLEMTFTSQEWEEKKAAYGRLFQYPGPFTDQQLATELALEIDGAEGLQYWAFSPSGKAIRDDVPPNGGEVPWML